MNWYDLHRMRLNFRFENPDKCRSIHSELFMYIVDLWNRLWQSNKFWLPTEMTMNLLGIWSYNTYNKAYIDLVSRWFIKEIKKSTNQYSARIIAISKIDKAIDKALDKATIKATDKATDDINKQQTTNNKTIYIPQEIISFFEKQKENMVSIAHQIKTKPDYIEKQTLEYEKLLKDLDKIKAKEMSIWLLEFITQDKFWKNNIWSITKLRSKNKDWVPYYIVMLEKMKQEYKKNTSNVFVL